MKNPKPTKVDPAQFMLCRLYQHHWRPFDVKRIGGKFEASLICRNCESMRVDKISILGELVSRHYVYHEKYLRKGEGTLTAKGRMDLRVEFLNRRVS